jgi:CelD/BcsL family acetyltransferase involved in cellulose biosynthesis
VGEPHFDYQEPLVLPGSKVTGLISALDHELHEQGDWCEKFSLYRFRLQTLTEFRADAAQVSPCIRLDPGGGLDAFLRARSSHFLAGIARQRRQLAAVGNVTLQTFLPDQSLEAEGELERMIAAYEDVHAGEGSAGLFRAPGTREFYLRLLTVLLPAGLVQFSVLRAGGIACSWVVGFLCRGVFSYYKPVYARQYARLSPGKLHLSMLTEHGMQAGWRAIDLGPGVEPYKKWWTDEAVPLGMVEGRTRTLRSRVGRILSGLKARR